MVAKSRIAEINKLREAISRDVNALTIEIELASRKRVLLRAEDERLWIELGEIGPEPPCVEASESR